MTDILYDARWVGNHGIGRFAGELWKLLPQLKPYQARRPPWHPLDPPLLGAALWRRRPALFFSPGYNSPMGWPYPFVFTLHDLNHWSVPENSNAAKRAYYKYVIRPACHNAACVLTGSEYSRNEIREWAKLSDEKIVAVSYGVGLPFGTSGGRYEPGYPYLLYVGNRKPHKNLARLLRAFAVSGVRRMVRLVLTGTRDSEISAQIDGLGLDGDVRFAESPGDQGLANLYRGAEGLLFPSLYEGFGLPALEAMACGVPVLTSNVCSLPEVVGDAAVLVDPLEMEGIADGIRRLIEDDTLREGLRRKGLERARQFSWEETARRTWKVLQTAAGARG
jgi:glycosyltransferase involved in cell wall biosynthesis